MEDQVFSHFLSRVRVVLCDTQTIPNLVSLKWDGVSFINNIEYGNEGTRVWRSYAVGPGKFLPWSKFNFQENYSVPVLNILKEAKVPKAEFTLVIARRNSAQTQLAEDQVTVGVAEDTGGQDDDDVEYRSELSRVLHEDGCIKSFQRFSSLQRRLEVGKHSYALKNEMLFHKAMVAYATKLEQGITTSDNPIEVTATPTTSVNSRSMLSKGWALKPSTAQKTRLTEK